MSTSSADEFESTSTVAEGVPAPRAEGVSEERGRMVLGKTSIADAVVAKIAGVAAGEVPGVHALGGGTARAFGALRERMPGASAPTAAQGVSVDVDDRRTTIELDVVIDYGVIIPELADVIRKNVTHAVETMTGLRVAEVNISVDDVHLPDDVDDVESQAARPGETQEPPVAE